MRFYLSPWPAAQLVLRIAVSWSSISKGTHRQDFVRRLPGSPESKEPPGFIPQRSGRLQNDQNVKHKHPQCRGMAGEKDCKAQECKDMQRVALRALSCLQSVSQAIVLHLCVFVFVFWSFCSRPDLSGSMRTLRMRVV